MQNDNVTDETNPKDLIGITKPDLALIPPASIIYEALAMQDGAAKYGPYNWRKKKVRAMIYLSALLRHTLALIDGQDIDPKSGKPHIGHAKACLGILADAKETGNLIDDRPIPGPAAELIEKYTVNK